VLLVMFLVFWAHVQGCVWIRIGTSAYDCAPEDGVTFPNCGLPRFNNWLEVDARTLTNCT
jgi:hypothetical protein